MLQVPPGLLGAGVVGRALWLTDPLPLLFPGEASAVERAVPRRVLEFTAGRAVARQALEGLGVPPCPILPGPDRVPGFPSGVVGSLSHSRRLAFAAVARRADVAGLGVDVEDDEPLSRDLVAIVTTAAERRSAPVDDGSWAKLMFSAKEAMFKCWCTGGGGRIAEFAEFDVEVTATGEVVAHRMPSPQLALCGRWARAHGAFWVAVQRR